jgi:hypothetical protein
MTLRSCTTILLAAMLLPCAAAHAQTSSRPVRHLVLSIPATDSNWTSTELIVEAGDLIAVHATGFIAVSLFSPEVDANGVRVGEAGTAVAGPGYLEFRIDDGAAKPAGANGGQRASVWGELQFRVHDVRYDDNAGKFELDVVVVPWSAIPPVPERKIVDRR